MVQKSNMDKELRGFEAYKKPCRKGEDWSQLGVWTVGSNQTLDAIQPEMNI